MGVPWRAANTGERITASQNARRRELPNMVTLAPVVATDVILTCTFSLMDSTERSTPELPANETSVFI